MANNHFLATARLNGAPCRPLCPPLKMTSEKVGIYKQLLVAREQHA